VPPNPPRPNHHTETRFVPQPARHLIDFLADYFEDTGDAF
jgi:hypothetical protein